MAVRSEREDEDDLLPVGTVIDGEYRIDGLLGAGGMGVVHRGYDLKLERPVAVKLHRGRGVALERLAREATALARLNHPNVVSVYRVGTHDGRVYVAMELVEGGTARKLADGTRPWSEVLRLYAAAGDGLAAAHAAGLVHRDFKPDNVLVGKDGRPRVADFGLARAFGEVAGVITQPTGPIRVDPKPVDVDVDVDVDVNVNVNDHDVGTAPTVEIGRPAPPSQPHPTATSGDEASQAQPGGYLAQAASSSRRTPPPLDVTLTVTGGWVGTPGYMAPEQLDGGFVDARTDQFAFALSVWEGLHGRRPFRGQSSVELRRAIARTEIDAQRRPGVPRWIDDVLMRALSEAPGDRWPDMAALLAALRDDRSGRRRRGVFAAGAVALAAGAAVIAWQVRGSSRAAPTCRTGAAEIAVAWSASHAASLRAAFAATHLPYAADLADKVVAELDGYAANWAARADAACRARAAGQWSQALADRSLACLTQREAGLGQVVVALESIDAEQLDRVTTVIDALDPVADCASPAALDGQPVRPSDPERARAYDSARAGLDRGRIRDGFDRTAEAIGELDAALTDARRSGVDALTATVQLARGQTGFSIGEAGADHMLEDAYFTARRSRSGAVAARAAATRAHAALRAGKLDVADTWQRQAEAEVAAGDLGPGVASQVELSRSLVLARQGRLADAVAAVEDARRDADRAEPGDGADPADLLDYESSMLADTGQLDRAIAIGEDAVKAYEDELGPKHPQLSTTVSNLGLTMSHAGRHDEAIALEQRALSLCRPVAGCAFHLPTVLLNLASAQIDAGKDREALAALDEAEPLMTGHEGTDADLAFVWSNRGLAFDHLDRLADAEAAYRKALALSERANGVDHPDVAEILNNLASVLNAEQHWSDAAAAETRAIAIWEKSAPGALGAGLPMVGLGRAQLGLGQPRVAAATLRTAIQRLDAGGFAPQLRGVARLRLSQALWATGDAAEARRMATEARAVIGVEPSLTAEIDAWQATMK